ncbi:uncharacterized protein LOC130827030 [Amaranthus tricolor]|uniref:uncharacterized protein LOC130827030 n=1 Tax=Amaranthus tricolor TaxID=29722 RepID=UPI00258F4820|nr:uncharacterized protein LOC130827030 [Amaranthus tricolor]
MDIPTSERLAIIDNQIHLVEAERLACEQRLALFWEHLPAIDPADVAAAMQNLQGRICNLKNRKRDLLNEKQALIVQAITHLAPGRRED